MSEVVEVTFNPTARDYALTQRWLTRHVLGRWFAFYITLLASCAAGLIFGFVLLVDAAYAYGSGPLHDQAILGSAAFMISSYTLIFSLIYTRRTVSRILYCPNGYYLAQRTVSFSDHGIVNKGGISTISIEWRELQGLLEDRHYLYLKLEPAFCLFIPKRVIGNPEDLHKLKILITKKCAESGSNI